MPDTPAPVAPITDERLAELEPDSEGMLSLGVMLARAGEWPALVARMSAAEAELAQRQQELFHIEAERDQAIAERDAIGARHERALNTGAEVRAERDRYKAVVGFVESWVDNPVGSYSTHALDGLFAMTRDRIAALKEPPHG